jgi:PAS domain S-box-containing protein
VIRPAIAAKESRAMAAGYCVGQILVIGDDPDAQANLRDILEMDGYEIQAARCLGEVLCRPSMSEFEVILLDRRLPDGDALDCLPRLRQLAPDAGVVVVTVLSDLEGAIEAFRHGAADYIPKPIDPDSLRLRIGRLTEQRRLRLAKERGDTVFRNLVEAAECMIVMLRPQDHAILYYSPFAEQLTGYRAEDVLGRSFLEVFIPEEDRHRLLDRYRMAFQGHPQREIEGKIVCRDGTARAMVRNIRCLPDYDGSPALLIVGHDITELKTAQERALQAGRMAAIGQMCAGLAHESRNALQRSQACLEMLALKLVDRPDACNLMDRIQQAQDDLHRLYEDVREYAAPIKLAIRECHVGEAWRRAWSQLEPAREGWNARLLEPANGLDLVCQADGFRLEQVFRNILENALAACPARPEIVIRGSTSSLDGRDALRISIRDNGPGLNSEQRSKIFESFYTTRTRGTGLGMAIVKRIVEAHGGSVEVGGHEGPGAEIVVTLPREQGR